MSILLRLRYDGTDFCGFAKQQGSRSVQGELESALTALYRSPIVTRGASRTDSGVHARGQLVAFEPPRDTTIPLDGLLRAIGGFLPRDLSVWDAWEQWPADELPLNPRFGNQGKRYRYRIRSASQRDPTQGRYLWELRLPLEIEPMRRAAEYLVGEHDFSAFRAADCQAAHARRRIDAIYIESRADPLDDVRRYGQAPDYVPSIIDITVEGNAFLKYMVRIITGTLVAVGKGQCPPAWVKTVLDGKSRPEAGPTAPAQGLTLLEVRWPEPKDRLRGAPALRPKAGFDS